MTEYKCHECNFNTYNFFDIMNHYNETKHIFRENNEKSEKNSICNTCEWFITEIDDLEERLKIMKSNYHSHLAEGKRCIDWHIIKTSYYSRIIST